MKPTPPISPPPARRGLCIQQTYESLRDDIMAQRIGAGVKLTAEQLATRFHVSRTPVNHALERLYQEGYVTRIPARGYFVAEVEFSEARDLYDVRIALEVYALEAAFERGFPRQAVERLTAVNKEYRRSLKDQKAVHRVKIDKELHLALAALSGNPMLVNMLREVHDKLYFHRLASGYWIWHASGARATRSVSEHAALIEAVLANDKKAALKHLRTHLANAVRNYEKFRAATTQ